MHSLWLLSPATAADFPSYNLTSVPSIALHTKLMLLKHLKSGTLNPLIHRGIQQLAVSHDFKLNCWENKTLCCTLDQCL